MAYDLLQETWYAMARTSAREPIENPRGYFYRTMVNTWRHMSLDMTRHGIPADDLDAARGPTRPADPPSKTRWATWTPRIGGCGCGPGGPNSG